MLTMPANLTSLSCLLFCKKTQKSSHLTPAVSGGVSATSEACHNLQGESPCRVRLSQPPVSSLARCAESEISEHFSA